MDVLPNLLTVVLHKLQKRVVRIIDSSKYNTHTEPLCPLLKMQKPPDLYQRELYKRYYKIQRKQVPQYIIFPVESHISSLNSQSGSSL